MLKILAIYDMISTIIFHSIKKIVMNSEHHENPINVNETVTKILGSITKSKNAWLNSGFGKNSRWYI